jgi:hypothetical protein
MSGPLPTHFRWLWYLVGLAGMVLAVVGILAMLGSALDTGILIPFVVIAALAVGGAVIWFRRSLDAAVAAAPSRQGSGPAGGPGGNVGTSDAEIGAGGGGPAAAELGPPEGSATRQTASKPPANPGRTSRRSP